MPFLAHDGVICWSPVAFPLHAMIMRSSPESDPNMQPGASVLGVDKRWQSHVVRKLWSTEVIIRNFFAVKAQIFKVNYYYYRSANPKPSGHRAYTQRVCSHTMGPLT